MKLLHKLALIITFVIGVSSCNKDEEVTIYKKPAPEIELESETGVYLLKVGKDLTFKPTIKNDEDAYYSWVIDNKLVSTDKTFSFHGNTEGSVFVLFTVETKYGSAEEEIRIDVANLAPPVISFVIPSWGLKVLANTDYILTPDIQNSDGATYEWKMGTKVVGTDSCYTFNQKEVGIYDFTLSAKNEDGETKKEIQIEVLETLPYSASFETPSFFQTSTERNVFNGKTVYLEPLLEFFENPIYAWSVNDEAVADIQSSLFAFTPKAAGKYTVGVSVTEGKDKSTKSITRNITRSSTSVEATVIVNCLGIGEADRKRPATGASSELWNKVYEYVPAPGQFINELKTGGFAGNENTPEAAVEYATKRLNQINWVSLGGFGGYIIVGFDHSLENKGSYKGYDFSITGNAFKGSSEPGIVWVMQDTNGNGLPDDEWYELTGSDFAAKETIHNYAVTYYRPAGTKMNVQWTDNSGQTGNIDYLPAYHQQDYYYPNWIKADTYTLRGTFLKAKTTQDPVSGFWTLGEFDWGYADNFGKDTSGSDNAGGGALANYFAIRNAVTRDGKPVALQYVDFIKVQTGVNDKSGWLGENSTEVCSFSDLNLTK